MKNEFNINAYMKIFVTKDVGGNEARVAVTPDIVKKLTDRGEHEVVFEDGSSNNKCLADSDIIISINPPSSKIIKAMKKGAISIAMQKPHVNSDNIDLFKERGITSFALDLIPRTTRAQYMDVLSSQASLAGYRAVIEASHLLNRAFPMMMTTAGTIPAAKVLIIGAGVAGLQAVATAKRLGAIVNVFDVRASAKEQVESLGAKFVEVESKEKMDGVYASETSDEYKKAQEERLRTIIATQDIIITTAQIPFKKAPIIVKKDMLDLMKDDSVVIDLASESGGNCELTKHGEIISYKKVRIVSFVNILNGIHHDASKLFAKNVYAFLELLFEKLKENSDISTCDDEIIKGTLLTYNNQVINEKFK